MPTRRTCRTCRTCAPAGTPSLSRPASLDSAAVVVVGTGFRAQPHAAREANSAFPQVVAWLGLGIALLLFCGNTVPALRDRAELRATASDLQLLRLQYDAAIAHAIAGTPGASGQQDLQSVLVAIDRIGWTPQELLSCYPPVRAGTDSADGDAAAPRRGD